jgi:hypothetical protein
MPKNIHVYTNKIFVTTVSVTDPANDTITLTHSVAGYGATATLVKGKLSINAVNSSEFSVAVTAKNTAVQVIWEPDIYLCDVVTGRGECDFTPIEDDGK